jgi:predicted phosphodiesterase
MKKPWTKNEIASLKKLRAAGKPATEIAATLLRSVESVQWKAKVLGFPAVAAETPLDKLVHPPVLAPTKGLKPPEFGYLDLKMTDAGDWVTFGLVSDTHLCCKEERLSELHNQYDIFEREGIETVFHAGNILDGYIHRINGASVFETTIDGQSQYVVDNYPSRKGITTHFITGDDHESWFSPGFNIGGYIALLAKNQGRTDLNYIGHVEADVEIKTKGTKGPVSTIIKIQHPGGGSAYARSYTGQKQIEALEGGEKPSILVQGHYHVSNYMQERNVHVISMPGFQDQTIFARKKRLRMEVGGAILQFKVSPDDGSVTRCRVEFNRYFTRGYYKHYLHSDAKILKGHLVLKK